MKLSKLSKLDMSRIIFYNGSRNKKMISEHDRSFYCVLSVSNLRHQVLDRYDYLDEGKESCERIICYDI